MTLIEEYLQMKNKAPDRIRAYRTARKLSQQKLAEQLGVTGAYISQIETRRRPASLKVLSKFIQLEET